MEIYPEFHKFYFGTVRAVGKRFRLSFNFSKNNPLHHLNREIDLYFDTYEEGILKKKELAKQYPVLRPRSMLFDYGTHFGIELTNLK